MSEKDMEHRVSSLEHQAELRKLESTHAQQRLSTSVEGLQSQMAEMIRMTRESLSQHETDNNAEITALRGEFAETHKELAAIGRKLTYYSGGLAACGAVGFFLVSAVIYVFNTTNQTHTDRQAAAERRVEKIENQQEELQRTLHRIELYLARGGEPDRGTYTGEQKK
jgi:DnaJ-domain-containing protein 1